MMMIFLSLIFHSTVKLTYGLSSLGSGSLQRYGSNSLSVVSA